MLEIAIGDWLLYSVPLAANILQDGDIRGKDLDAEMGYSRS